MFMLTNIGKIPLGQYRGNSSQEEARRDYTLTSSKEDEDIVLCT